MDRYDKKIEGNTLKIPVEIKSKRMYRTILPFLLYLWIPPNIKEYLPRKIYIIFSDQCPVIVLLKKKIFLMPCNLFILWTVIHIHNNLKKVQKYICRHVVSKTRLLSPYTHTNDVSKPLRFRICTNELIRNIDSMVKPKMWQNVNIQNYLVCWLLS